MTDTTYSKDFELIMQDEAGSQELLNRLLDNHATILMPAIWNHYWNDVDFRILVNETIHQIKSDVAEETALVKAGIQ